MVVEVQQRKLEKFGMKFRENQEKIPTDGVTTLV